MAFSREPMWDCRRGLAGFWLAAREPVAGSSGSPSIWLAISLLGWEQPGARRGRRVWALDAAQWGQAMDLRRRLPESFASWASHLSACGAWLACPRLERAELDESLALIEALAEAGVPTLAAEFALDPCSIALASRCAGAALDAAALGHERAGELAARLAQSGKIAIVRGVDSSERARALGDAGAGPFLGSGLWSRSGSPQAARIEPSAAKALAALALVLEEAEIDEIEQAFHADPPLAYRLVALANSAAFGRPGVRASCARHAVVALGRARLAQWLCCAVALPQGARPDHGAARWALGARAKLCELLAKACPSTQSLGPQAFTCGVFSGLPSLLECPSDALGRACPLPEPLAGAVSRGAGPLGALLRLAMACEAPAGPSLAGAALAAELGIGPQAFADARRQAFEWACDTVA